jgi:hypothetical protein
MDITTLTDYIQKNTISTKAGRKCVDGRYENDRNSGMIARAGGDLGYVMALLSLSETKNLGLSPIDCFEKVYSALSHMGEEFYAHTDTHSEEDSTSLIGCGHAGKPTNPELAPLFKLQSEDMTMLVKYMKNKAQSDPKIHIVVLPGSHKETGVIVVTGIKNTVKAHDAHNMYFIYDKNRDDMFMEKLFIELGIETIPLDEFKKVSDIQLGATLELLAKGLPIFEVNADTDMPEVKLQGVV